MKTYQTTFLKPGPRAFVRLDCASVEVSVRVNGHEVGHRISAWTPFEIEVSSVLDELNLLEIDTAFVDHPLNGFLPDVGIHWHGVRGVHIRSEPTPKQKAAVQRSGVDGERLLLDGEPFVVRGILHWGYYPELKHPWPPEARMRSEIEDLLARGFNLIKFCLWIPPQRYYELCEELGMMVWQEYPLWNRPLDNEELLPHYERFFENDAPYSCVILRSLTCENDHVAPELADRLMERAEEIIPGALLLDNSGWLCSERRGPFHDEHLYLHNLQIPYYRDRMKGRLSKPLLLGESLAVDSVDASTTQVAREVRRYQIGTLARDFPHAGYVVTALRDLESCPLGLYTSRGELKDSPEDWAWHGLDNAPHRTISPKQGDVFGPRKGAWKCTESTFWSPVIKVLDEDLPRELIEREALFDLFTGRALTHTDGCRVLIEHHDVHDRNMTKRALVIEFCTEGERRVVSSLRDDTKVGRELRELLEARKGDAPEIGPLHGDAILLRDWTMHLEGERPRAIVADTPFANDGKNVFEGHATFRTRFESSGGEWILCCESVGDYYRVLIDDQLVGEAGNRTGTWDGTRDVPQEFPLSLTTGEHTVEVQVRDWRGAGGMIGPVFLTQDTSLRIF